MEDEDFTSILKTVWKEQNCVSHLLTLFSRQDSELDFRGLYPPISVVGFWLSSIQNYKSKSRKAGFGWIRSTWDFSSSQLCNLNMTLNMSDSRQPILLWLVTSGHGERDKEVNQLEWLSQWKDGLRRSLQSVFFGTTRETMVNTNREYEQTLPGGRQR